MDYMETDGESPILQRSACLKVWTVPHSTASTIPCDYCSKSFTIRKKWNDHHRTVHGSYYVNHRGSTIPSPFLPTVELTSSTGEGYILRKDKVTRCLHCRICKVALPPSRDKIKAHYSTHDVQASVTITYPALPTGGLAADSNPTTIPSSPGLNVPSSVDHDPVMDVDAFPADYAQEDCSAGGDLAAPEEDSPESWDMDSIYSDYCDDVLGEGQEDAVVPLSFILPSSAIRPTDDEGENCSTDDEEEGSILPPNELDLPSQLVYGSGSRCSDAFELLRSHCFLTKC